jgi:hypothetical protein
VSLTRRIQRLETVHGDRLDRCGTCGSPDPDVPDFVITRDASPLPKCEECGAEFDESGRPLPAIYKRLVLPDGGEGV